MEIYKTKDNLVTKYIHDDGSETAIKNVPSCDNEINFLTDDIIPIKKERNKFSVFISSSVGCPVKCKFCYLTVKNYPYFKLTPEQIITNTIKVIEQSVIDDESLRKKYIKLSFMGMGDILLFEPKVMIEISRQIIEYCVEHYLTLGVDTIDFGTTIPKYHKDLMLDLYLLNNYIINNYDINPNKKENQSVVRIFYSHHSCYKRDELIGRSYFKNSTIGVLEYLYEFEEFGIDVILHQILLKNINDNEYEIYKLRDLINEVGINPEIRILRYNECENSMYKETDKFEELVKLYSKNFNKVKYQISAGSEIKASCGQFICKKLKSS